MSWHICFKIYFKNKFFFYYFFYQDTLITIKHSQNPCRKCIIISIISIISERNPKKNTADVSKGHDYLHSRLFEMSDSSKP